MKCVICQRRDADETWTVCRGCLAHLDDNLAAIVDLSRAAAGWLSPRSGHGEGVRSVPASRPPLDVASLDAALCSDALPLCESWERLTREHFGLGPYGPASRARSATLAAEQVRSGIPTPLGNLGTLRAVVGFLRSWLLRMVEDASYPVDDLAREVRELRGQLDSLDPERQNTAGERLLCPADHPDGDGRPCHNRINLIPGAPRDDVYCRRCGTTWNTNRLKLLCLHDDTQRIWRTPAEIVEIVDVPKRTIQRWADKGLIERQGIRYDLGGVWRLRMRVGA